MTGKADPVIATVSKLDPDSRLKAEVFVFLGAEPNTEWLGMWPPGTKGFVNTGDGLLPDVDWVAFKTETSFPNLFAVVDVRSGSTKRVASTVGEGAGAVSDIQAALRLITLGR